MLPQLVAVGKSRGKYGEKKARGSFHVFLPPPAAAAALASRSSIGPRCTFADSRETSRPSVCTAVEQPLRVLRHAAADEVRAADLTRENLVESCAPTRKDLLSVI